MDPHLKRTKYNQPFIKYSINSLKNGKPLQSKVTSLDGGPVEIEFILEKTALQKNMVLSPVNSGKSYYFDSACQSGVCTVIIVKLCEPFLAVV